MHFLMGDSTESGLEFNYLAFLKDVIDASVVLLENEAVIAASIDRKKSCERDAAIVVGALGELGRRTLEMIKPVAKEHTDNAIGRCATAIAAAAREAVDREAQQVRTALAADLAEIEKVPLQLRTKNADVLDKLLRTHDLPLSEKTHEVVFATGSVQAAMRQRTMFGVDSQVAIEIPPSSLLQPDLRVDKLVDNAELGSLEVGGWLRKSDKLVALKIGRYVIGKIVVGNHVTVRLRATPEADSPAFDLVLTRTGEVLIENVSGEPARELTIDEAHRPTLKALAEKLEAAVRKLGDRRVGAAAVQIDGVPLGEHAHPGTLAERLILAVAPMVHRIAKHTRSPGELVLRRMLGEDRREEIFVTTAELVKRWSGLPPAAREVFAPLRLEADPAAVVPEVSGPHRRTAMVTGAHTRARSTTNSMPPPPPGLRAPSSSEASVTLPPAAIVAAAPVPDEEDAIPELTDIEADESPDESSPESAAASPETSAATSSASASAAGPETSPATRPAPDTDHRGVDATPHGELLVDPALPRVDHARISAAIDAALEDE